MLDLVVV